ncbi:MAG: DUF5683 domain-containing protein [Bacteroidales bacterium]|nr:DUF5683 domain-containing protein [Bacteroidales bacterium]
MNINLKTFTSFILFILINQVVKSQQVDETISHSPHKATFYSAILPGLGQAYNKKYWKIPIVYAGIGALSYAINFNSKYYKKYKSAYRDWIINDPNNKSYLEFIPSNLTEEEVRTEHNVWFEEALNSKKQRYRRYRDLSYIGMTALYVLQIMDAAVDAHFYNFDISDDLSLNVSPGLIENTAEALPVFGLKLKIRIM